MPPFWLSSTEEPYLIETLNSLKPINGFLNITLEGFSHFGNRVLFIQVKENEKLCQLKTETEMHFTQNFKSIKKEDRSFHPHVTIATRDLKPGDFIKAWEYYSKQNFLETFNVPAVSVLKLSGGRWQVMAENKMV